MKSPLSLLARLMARGRAPEPEQRLAVPDSHADVAKLEVQPTPAVEKPDGPEVPIDSFANKSVVAEAPLTIVEAEAGIGNDEPVTLPLAEERADPAPEPTPPVTKSRAPRIAKKAPDRDAVATDTAAGDDQSGQSAIPVQEIYSDEVNLDADIAELRKQLSQKLRLQNAQLKKRLERFDRY